MRNLWFRGSMLSKKLRSSGFFHALLFVGLSLVLAGCSGQPASPLPGQGAGGSFTLRVTDLDGNGVEGAVVRFAGTRAAEIVSGSDGSARFADLPPGEYTVQASKGNMSHSRIEFELNDGESLTRAALLRPVKEFEIIGHIRDVTDYRFNGTIPGPTLSAKEGDLVRVFLSVPENDIAHAFAIDEFGVSSRTIHRGESTVIEFVANQAGEFYYYCPLPSHRTLGMEGRFVVEKGDGVR